MRYLFITCVLSFFNWNVYSQVFNQTSPLSQNTNYYLNTVSDGRTFIGSVDGLNVFDGLHTSIYRPSTHNMFGNNIQSEFYEDKDGDVWFVTYQALHVYRKRLDDLEYQFMNVGVDTFKNDYRVIDQMGDSLILSANYYGFIFDLEKEEMIDSFSLPKIYFDKYLLIDEIKGYTLIAIDELGTHVLKYDKSFHLLDDNFLDIKGTSIFKNEDGVWIGSTDGYLYHIEKKNYSIFKRFKLGEKSLTSIQNISSKSLLIAGVDRVFKFSLRGNNAYQEIQFKDQNDKTLTNVFLAKVQEDSILWVSSDGKGVFFEDLKKKEFGKWPLEKVGPSITGIHPIKGTQNVLVTTRLNGIFILDHLANQVFHQPHLLNIRKNFTVLYGCMFEDNKFLFNSYGKVFLFDCRDYSLTELYAEDGNADYFVNPTVMSNDRIVTSTYQNYLSEIKVKNGSFSLSPYELNWGVQNSTNIKRIAGELYAVSINEESIAIIKYLPQTNTFQRIKNMAIAGGVRSVCNINDSLFYISNVNGLFEIDIDSFEYRQIPGPNNSFYQTIYSIIRGVDNLFWMSTNKGIISYDRNRNFIRQFNESDGIQAWEYNSHAYHQNQSGVIYFGGVKGLNYFHPGDMIESSKEAQVFITDYKINDESSRTYGVPNEINDVVLPYENNTIAFSFHALDYKDPQSTKVKYFMSSEDKNFVFGDGAQGNARYANLSPGDYTFSIIGANADGVWNDKSRDINISVIPPFWMTWWFRLLSAIVVGSIIFGAIRYYYNQQLKQRDFLLREQQLIIEKQTALQEERTRIAGEMHDDLGGGLTSIKYLSQKIVKNIRGEENVKQVHKIINHAQTLVTNMSEIIWAMNSGFDTLENLIAYCRRYTFEYLEENDIEVAFTVEGEPINREITGERRRNIFLILKEALNNIVKHSKAKSVDVNINLSNNNCTLIIRDDGIGFNEAANNGNGLKNMKERADKLDGKIHFDSKSNGLTLSLIVPILPLENI